MCTPPFIIISPMSRILYKWICELLIYQISDLESSHSDGIAGIVILNITEETEALRG